MGLRANDSENFDGNTELIAGWLLGLDAAASSSHDHDLFSEPHNPNDDGGLAKGLFGLAHKLRNLINIQSSLRRAHQSDKDR